jgi:hypothetical protein
MNGLNTAFRRTAILPQRRHAAKAHVARIERGKIRGPEFRWRSIPLQLVALANLAARIAHLFRRNRPLGER